MLTAIFLKKDNIAAQIERLELETSEKEKLLELINEMAEYKLLSLVLERLEEKDKQLFLEQIYGGRPEIFIEFLREKIKDAEKILLDYASGLEMEILKDIKEITKE